MNWVREKRASTAWEGSWRNQTLASISPPPFPLLALVFIIFSLLYLSYSGSNQHHAFNNFKLFLVFLPFLIIILAYLMSKLEKFASPQTKPEYHGGVVAQRQRQWELPWGVVAMVMFLLLMASFHPSFN
ncbi:hypothetical protein LINPERHAP1_LOCUS30801 [Linum perenne]